MVIQVHDAGVDRRTAIGQEGAIALARGKLGRNMLDHERAEELDRDGWFACATFGVLGMPVADGLFVVSPRS
jgi:hypothetical protein